MRGCDVPQTAADDRQNRSQQRGRELADETEGARHTAEQDDGRPTNSVRSAVHVLRALAEKRTAMGVSEIARRAHLPKTTAHRLISTLVECGMVERNGTRFSIGLGSASIGAAYEHSVGRERMNLLRETATPYLQQLLAKTNETVHLAVLDGAEVLYLDKIFGNQPTRVPSRIGARLPANCTASGKVLLAGSSPEVLEDALHDLRRLTPYSQSAPGQLFAELSRVQQHKIAFACEEAALGLVCVAAPIMDRDGSTYAAVSVAGPINRFDVKRASVAVQRTADHISAAMNSHEQLRAG